jgi:hypothetical protein
MLFVTELSGAHTADISPSAVWQSSLLGRGAAHGYSRDDIFTVSAASPAAVCLVLFSP